MPSNDHANRSMWPVRCSSIVRPGSRPSGSSNMLFEIGVGQHAASVAAQADAGIVEPRRRRHRLHVDERIAVLAGGCCDAPPPSPPCRARVRIRRLRGTAWPACGSGRGCAASDDRRADPQLGRRGAPRWRRRASCTAMPPCPMSAIVSIDARDRARAPARKPSRTASVPAAIAGAIVRLREDRERVLARRLDDDVEGFRRARCGTRRPSPDARTGRRPRRRSSSSPGIRTSKYDIAEPLMKRSRTRSPGLNSPVQLPAGVMPFIR